MWYKWAFASFSYDADFFPEDLQTFFSIYKYPKGPGVQIKRIHLNQDAELIKNLNTFDRKK